mgnify:CR=1 FL=1
MDMGLPPGSKTCKFAFMAILGIEFSREGHKTREVLGPKSTVVK